VVLVCDAARVTAFLVAEAARKSRVCWLSYRHPHGEVRDRLVWHAWHDDALVVVDGDDHQRLPGLAEAASALVSLRSKETRTALVTVEARVEAVPPDAPGWEEHCAALLAVRLNLRNPAATRTAWAELARIVRLVPAG